VTPPLGLIPVNEPLLDGNERKYLSECIDTGWISSEGPFVKQFEELFSARVGRKFGISVTSGSSALETGVAALGIGRGDEVILPQWSVLAPARCSSTAIRHRGTWTQNRLQKR